jgi:hypothetical protein
LLEHPKRCEGVDHDGEEEKWNDGHGFLTGYCFDLTANARQGCEAAHIDDYMAPL